MTIDSFLTDHLYLWKTHVTLTTEYYPREHVTVRYVGSCRDGTYDRESGPEVLVLFPF